MAKLKNALLESDIKTCRDSIYQVSLQILNDCFRRCHIANELADIKVSNGLPLEDPERENELMESLVNPKEPFKQNLLTDDEVRELFGTIFSITKRVERRHIEEKLVDKNE
jgi:chorismate mutase